jgi:sensor histidine kinase YesM
MKKPKNLGLVQKVFFLSLMLLTLPALIFAFYLYEKQTTNFYDQLLQEQEVAIEQLTENVQTMITFASDLSKGLSYRSPLIDLLRRQNLSEYPIWSERYIDEIVSSLKYSVKYQNLGINAVRIYSLNTEISNEEAVGSYFYSADKLKSLSFFKDFLTTNKMVALYYLSGDNENAYYSKMSPTASSLKYNTGTLLMIRRILGPSQSSDLGYMVFEMSPQTVFPKLTDNFNKKDGYLVYFTNLYNFYGAQPPEHLKEALKNSLPQSGVLTINNQKYLCNTIDEFNVLIVDVKPVSRIPFVHSALNLSLILIWLSIAQLFILTMFIKHAFARLHKDLNQMDSIVAHEFNGRISIGSEDEVGQIAKRYNILLDRIDTLVDSLVQKETANTVAQLKSLQYQINPHFIYNTLNIFSGCAEQKGCSELAESIASFGHLLRYNLKSESMYSTVEQELQNAISLIGVYSIRYFNRLRLNIHADPDVRRLRLIKFLLQPLLENSILHGLVPPHTSMLIQVIIESSNRLLSIRVIDDGVGMSTVRLQQVCEGVFNKNSSINPPTNGFFIGLRNIWERMQLFYGNGVLMEITSTEGCGMSVLIQIPLELTLFS